MADLPFWIADEELGSLNKANVAFRIATQVLASDPDVLMRGALAGDDSEQGPAAIVAKILAEGQEMLKDRLELLRSAQVRVPLTAAFVYCVKLPA